MHEIGRRGFITGLAALVAAPAVIRVAPLMKISSLYTPVYVPVSWLAEWLDTRAKGLEMLGLRELKDLRSHGWERPMADNWVNIHDFDPAFVRQWGCAQVEEENYPYA